MQNAMGSYCTYLSLVKLQRRFLSLQWKTCLWAELQPCLPEFAVKDLPFGRTLMIMINIIVIMFGEGYALSLVDVYC